MNQILKKLYEEDQKDRDEKIIDWNNPKEVEEVGKRDKERRKIIKTLLFSSKVKDRSDYYHVAMIFQHGDSPSDYKNAHQLAKKAMEMGEEKAKWLFAATLDRWLLSMEKSQKFGTQFKENEKGEWDFAGSVDKLITDNERKKYNVPPLSQAVKLFKKRNNLS